MYTSLAANYFFVTAETQNHFEPGAYSNTTGLPNQYLLLIRNVTAKAGYEDIGYKYPTDPPDIQLFTSILEGYNASTPSYEDLTPSHCLSVYNTAFLSRHRNLFLITNYTSNSTSNSTLLRFCIENGFHQMGRSWICPPSLWALFGCNTNELASKLARGNP